MACQIVGLLPVPSDALLQTLPERDPLGLPRSDQRRAQAIVKVMRRVGKLVGRVRYLGFEMSTLFRVVLLSVGDIVLSLMFDDTLTHLPGEVQSWELRIAAFKRGDDSQRLLVMIEPPVLSHQAAQGSLASVPERRVAEVVSQADGLDQVFVSAERPGDAAPDLGNFQCVRETGPVVIPLGDDENLRLVLETTEGGRVDDTISIALEAGKLGEIVFRVREALALPGPP